MLRHDSSTERFELARDTIPGTALHNEGTPGLAERRPSRFIVNKAHHCVGEILRIVSGDEILLVDQ
jgi:hypothetical protein